MGNNQMHCMQYNNKAHCKKNKVIPSNIKRNQVSGANLDSNQQKGRETIKKRIIHKPSYKEISPDKNTSAKSRLQTPLTQESTTRSTTRSTTVSYDIDIQEEIDDDEDQYNFDFKDVKSIKKINDINELYEVGKVIGEGTQGQIRQVRNKKFNMKLAMKIQQKNKISESENRIENMLNELKILDQINHSNIVRVYELLHDKENIYIISDFVQSGDLLKLINRRENCMSENEVKLIARQLMESLVYLEKNKIVHRDIKFENILVDYDPVNCNNLLKGKAPTVYLTDFGFANHLDTDGKLTKKLGSRYYVAPEILFKNGYGSKVDVWSTTMVILGLLVGELPYKGQDIQAVARELKKIKIDKILEQHPDLSKQAKDFISLGLQFDEELRGDSQKMLDHPWLKPTMFSKKISQVTKKQPSVQEMLFTLRAGYIIPKEQVQQVLTCMVMFDQDFARILEEFIVKKQKGTQIRNFQNLISHYLQQLSQQKFYELIELVKSYQKQEKSKMKR